MVGIFQKPRLREIISVTMKIVDIIQSFKKSVFSQFLANSKPTLSERVNHSNDTETYLRSAEKKLETYVVSFVKIYLIIQNYAIERTFGFVAHNEVYFILQPDFLDYNSIYRARHHSWCIPGCLCLHT